MSTRSRHPRPPPQGVRQFKNTQRGAALRLELGVRGWPPPVPRGPQGHERGGRLAAGTAGPRPGAARESAIPLPRPLLRTKAPAAARRAPARGRLHFRRPAPHGAPSTAREEPRATRPHTYRPASDPARASREDALASRAPEFKSARSAFRGGSSS